MIAAQWEIRPKYISMVKRYQSEIDVAKKIEMKHKFISWISANHNSLTDAEIEYLQASICPVEDIYL
jgi:hypothetical protein